MVSAVKNKAVQFTVAWLRRCGTVAIALAIMVSLAACGSGQVSEVATEVDDATVGATAPAVAAVPPTFPTLARLDGKATVVITVNGKEIEIEVDGDSAPVTAGNFVDLVKRKVYDGTVFHRVVRQPTPFVVQGGDPQSKDPNVSQGALGTGSFKDPKTGQARLIPLEILPEGAGSPLYSTTFEQEGISTSPVLSHTRGAVAMARSPAPDSASAQFYFALADLAPLDGSYAVFGYVTEGMDVVDEIQQGDRIESAEITAGADNLRLPTDGAE